jgi:hypothetical protein
VAVLRDPANPYQIAQFGAMQAVGPSLRVPDGAIATLINPNFLPAEEQLRDLKDAAARGGIRIISLTSIIGLRCGPLIQVKALRATL